MFDFLKPEATNPSPQQIARSLRWLGWGGLVLQSLLGFIPLLVVITTVFSRAGQQRSGSFFGVWLAIACLVILLFSIYWCFRYTQIASQLESRNQRPAKSGVIRTLKLGLLANISIMAIAVLVALSRVGELTFKMLTVPPGSTVITPNQTGSMIAQGALLTPSNMIAIQAMINAIAAGLVGVVVALVLLHQIGPDRNSND